MLFDHLQHDDSYILSENLGLNICLQGLYIKMRNISFLLKLDKSGLHVISLKIQIKITF